MEVLEDIGSVDRSLTFLKDLGTVVLEGVRGFEIIRFEVLKSMKVGSFRIRL